ncbi:hypothetical protein PM082_007957 [Marasmius tenuissimus]|nr:hypothetical protein PM082_007957 [Marasmius tenuissimus]
MTMQYTGVESPYPDSDLHLQVQKGVHYDASSRVDLYDSQRCSLEERLPTRWLRHSYERHHRYRADLGLQAYIHRMDVYQDRTGYWDSIERSNQTFELSNLQCAL